MPFILVFLICPAGVLIASAVLSLLFRRWYVAPALTLVVFTVLTFTVFNSTFLIWVFMYTALSAGTSLLVRAARP